ncbi:adaptor protein MecA [Nicoliella spurrieriana]|uniref:Adaptor protein MecA n=1 Tax=Nicoliella spurrieriana TaxID=2925830 RepID=A0A976RRD7_9LACO|nr:adaptor protein MecA [Nicoliella spurrieriana]UQS86422.1 adaptor protein MecA [Nicoliella spurrieriana]
MEMDRINDNTIRVLINNDDLSAHGITVLDLLGDHKQIEEFFYSILDEIDTDHQFQGDNEALTFQVLPNKNGLELFISKADPNDPAKTQQTNDTVTNYIKNQIKNRNLNEDIDQDLLNEGKAALNESKQDNDEVEQEPKNGPEDAVIEFDSFEDFISLAQELRIDNGISNLYLYKGKYYLELEFFTNVPGASDFVNENKIQFALEFGKSVSITPELLNEYGKKIMDNSALELARYYFKD